MRREWLYPCRSAMAGNHKNLSERLLRIRHTEAVTFGDFIYAPGGRLGPRTQRDFQLVLLFSGAAAIRADDRHVELRSGEMCVLAPGAREQFAFAPAGPTHHGWCSAQPGTLSTRLTERLSAAAREGKKAAVSARMAQLLEIAFLIPQPAADLLESLARTVFEELLCAVEAGTADPARPPLPVAVCRARDFIDAHYPEPVDLARLGRAAGVAPKHLGKLFRQHLGVTPVRHLWQVRTVRGAQLLAETGLTLGEIAERVGFQNPFHFSRLIRQEFGVSPRQWRAERWNAVPRS